MPSVFSKIVPCTEHEVSSINKIPTDHQSPPNPLECELEIDVKPTSKNEYIKMWMYSNPRDVNLVPTGTTLDTPRGYGRGLLLGFDSWLNC